MEIKIKINKGDQIKSFCIAKETIRTTYRMGKNLANEDTHKEFMPNTYKQLVQLNIKKIQSKNEGKT